MSWPPIGHIAARRSSIPGWTTIRDPTSEHSLFDLYRGSLDRNGRAIVAAVRHLVHAPSGGVLVHCAAGKDRTGIFVAVVLAALGAPAAAIVRDYSATEGRLDQFFARELAGTTDPERRARLVSRQHASPETMTSLLRHLVERHGGATSYLAVHGLSDPDLEQLVVRLTG